VRGLLALIAAFVVAGTAGSSPAKPAPDPRRAALRGFLSAVVRGEVHAMARLLSPRTRARLSLRGVSRMQTAVLPIARNYRFVLSERITSDFGVAAVVAPAGVLAAALRRTGEVWSLELMGPVRVDPVRPEPGERVVRRTQLAAEVGANRPITDAGLWFDGQAFPSRGGASADGRHLTMFGEAPQPLPPGRHTVVAFAVAGREASALAWTFSVRP
jgi:hypothetical protein